jgi:formylglycine-generating enzyme required for sulfatase activity
VLAALGDPRFDAGRFHLPADDNLGFVHVPANPAFVIGTRAADRSRVEATLGESIRDDEINDEPVGTGEFWIARYPVTVAQFRAFVQDTGLAPRDLNALRDPDNRPMG